MNYSEVRPPKLAEWILEKLLRSDIAMQRLGDYEEVFKYMAEEKGLASAKLWYWGELLKSLPVLLLNIIYWRGEMLKNYFKIAYRNIVKSKIYSFINIAGLSIGLACSFLILLWVSDEMSFDKFHDKADNIYHVYLQITNAQGEVSSQPTASFEISKLMVEKYPEVIQAGRFFPLGERVLKYGENKFIENNGFAVDPEVFEIFSFPFIKGDPKTSLGDPNSIVLTERMALKYFGDSNPIGKTIRINNLFDLTVMGIIQDIPHNSYLQFDYLLADSFRKNIGFDFPYGGNYFNVCSFLTFLHMQDNLDLDNFNKKFEEEIFFEANGVKGSYKLIPMTETNSFSKYNGESIYYLFMAIAFLILLLASINFVNLTTARSTNRLKEIGIRKVSGAVKSQLLFQLIAEYVFLSMISFLTAIMLVWMAMPVLNDITQKELSMLSTSVEMFSIFLIITLVTGILSGIYPAYIISSFNVTEIIKSKLKVRGKRFDLRQVLVVVQYSFTAVFFICSAIITSQFYFMTNADPGYVKEDVYYLRLDNETAKKAAIIKNEIVQNPQVLTVSSSSHLPVRISGGFFTEWGLNDNVTNYICPTDVDYDYLKTLNLKMEQGRFFNREFTSDKQDAIVINEEAAKRFEEENVVGIQFYFQGKFFNVIGVMKNFNHNSLQDKITPLVFFLKEEEPAFLFIKIKHPGIEDGTVAATLNTIQKVLDNNMSEYPAELQYLDSYTYAAEDVFNSSRKLISYATILALIISTLGLFGLSAYIAERRKKEIGIRKVLGSSIWNVVVKLSLSFIGLIIISNLIAIPIGYFIMEDFLSDFAFKIDITPVYFIVPALFILLVSIITVMFHSVKAAVANPAEIIKYE